MAILGKGENLKIQFTQGLLNPRDEIMDETGGPIAVRVRQNDSETSGIVPADFIHLPNPHSNRACDLRKLSEIAVGLLDFNQYQ